MTTTPTWQLMAETETQVLPPWLGEAATELWPYRDRTVALLRRYARSSVEVGRLPSLLGREFFRTRVTSYSLMTFEDIVIFVHDMERALERLQPLEQKLIAMNVLEEYTQAEIARLMGCTTRWIERQVPDAIDSLSRILLEWGLIREFARAEEKKKPCQEATMDDFPASNSKYGKNIF